MVLGVFYQFLLTTPHYHETHPNPSLKKEGL